MFEVKPAVKPTEKPEVRAFEAPYTDSIGAMIVSIQSEEYGIPITLVDQPDLQNIEQFYQNGAGNFWFAEYCGQVVGSIALLDIGHQQAALRKMFVAKEFRGREHGVAAMLLQTLIEWARTHQIAEIYLGTTAQFLAAHRFYEKHGFIEIGRSTLPNAFPVMAIDSKFYRYTL
ncbi:GNAT family N-acetyltransferase [Undibacterium cyanobacteriorum]|uniref:GNAT family N-acetyltransferase n=1 Tax=Undibacterium cyanobacteriorum TaxID=3073561 RepID=A0ABY9RGR1_9BURK|nr:GNAT family N-acetyltransferase [Undibacterium sp. 20NA77.5]WMW79301.1 GNAT family N-acetyltransferase [Undibacterium sp. 20NA77.5]